MPSHHKCAVKNCQDRVSVRHRFPNPRKCMTIFKLWMNCIGNKILQHLDPIEVYNNYRVCHAHFSEGDEYTNNRLRKDAVPSLNIPNPQIYSSIEQIVGMLYFFDYYETINSTLYYKA
nr:unnamed protein product [Callosobruchus chinensis]CAH7769410.1 unnamed protein product [Callosobruchus chinensis]